MKKNLHPAWKSDVVVTCACGNTFLTGSSLDSITVDICAKCHPFFTGEMKFVDRQGRVDRFAAKLQQAQAHQQVSTQKKKAKQKNQQAKSYQDILRDQQIELKKAEAA